MYSKLAIGLAMVGSSVAAELVRRDTGGGGGHGHGGGGGHGDHGGGSSYGGDSGHGDSGHGSGHGSGYGDVHGSGYGYHTGYHDDHYFDISYIIVPLLIILGLSLLFPTVTSVAVSNGRRKRDVEGANPLADAVDRVNDIYMAVVESEDCMQRIACEIGGLAEDVGLRENSLAKMAEGFVPQKYKTYYKQFQSGQNCHKIQCGSIF